MKQTEKPVTVTASDKKRIRSLMCWIRGELPQNANNVRRLNAITRLVNRIKGVS
jgi:hypothetical protein